MSSMPSRNTIKEYAENEYYHVYNRGVEKRIIFQDEQDYTVFIGLIKKYLNGELPSNHNRHAFTRLGDEVQVLAFCLMPNHFHLLLHQKSSDGVTKFLRRLATGYAMYFNNRYNRVGPLFQGKFKASRINADDYLHHISRYIHLNPADYKSWPYSSYEYYLGKRKAIWLTDKPILELFHNSRQIYQEFVEEYVDSKRALEEIKWQLAAYDDD